MQIKRSDGKPVDIEIHKKHVKNITLRVYPDGAVKISAPVGVSEASIKRFVESKKPWLEKHIQRAKMRQQDKPQKENELRLLGENYIMHVEKAAKNNVTVSGDTITVHCVDGGDHAAVLDKWWRKMAERYYNQYVEKWLGLLAGTRIQRPQVRIRKMKTMWGSCTCKRAEIRYNYYLMAAPPECVEYVVLHELAHLLYPNHGERFKAFLTKWMPDWKERKKRLSAEARILSAK